MMQVVLEMAKFSITLPEEVNKDLQLWADSEGRPKANLAAFLVESAVRAKYPGKYPTVGTRPAS
ncbi:MAG: hypothetical protein AAF327_07900 [Cyanobacteria bacterium P01_A01_bin.37]